MNRKELIFMNKFDINKIIISYFHKKKRGKNDFHSFRFSKLPGRICRCYVLSFKSLQT